MRRTPALLLSALLFTVAAATARSDAPPHWSFRHRGRPTVPSFADAEGRAWVGNAIDAFVLQRLRQEGLRPHCFPGLPNQESMN